MNKARACTAGSSACVRLVRAPRESAAAAAAERRDAELQAAAAAALEHGQVRCRARAGPGPTARHVPGAQGTQRPCIDMAGAYFA